MILGSVDTTGNNTEDKKRQKALMSNLQTILKVLQEEAEAGLFDINLGKNRLLYENMIFNSNKPKLKCRQGSILKNNVCGKLKFQKSGESKFLKTVLRLNTLFNCMPSLELFHTHVF